MIETQANGEQKPRLRFNLVVELDPATHSHGYQVHMDEGFPLAVAANICDKVHIRLIHDQLAIEAQQIAAAQAQQIMPANQMPPLPPNFRR